MINQEGRILYSLGLDNGQLREDADQSAAILRGIGNQAEAEGARMDAAFGKAARAVGASLAGLSVGSFVGQMFRVRSEFQDTESSMRVFLGSAERASAFMKELQDYAWYNMFEFSDLTRESAKLLAFGNDAGSIIPILDKLSNVAAGTKQPLGDLVDLYNKAKSIGKVDAMGLESWGARGVVVTDVLKEMGVEADRSAVRFEHLEMALDHVTGEGGRFNGLMNEQMENLSSSLGQLQDEIATMFNEIGRKSEGAMKGAIDLAGAVVGNYERIGRTLVELTALYGAYRAAIVATEAVSRAMNTVRHTEEAAALSRLLTVEQRAKIAKLGLAQTSAGHSAAVKKEVAANIEAARASLAKARAEVSAASQVATARRAEYAAAKQLERQRLAELAAIRATGTAKKIEAAQRKLAAAETGRESAALAFQSAAREFSAKKTAVETAAKQAGTLATKANTASQTANATATNILATAKLRLTAIAARLNAAIMANPYALAAAAVVALAYGIYKLATHQTEAEKAQNRLRDAIKEAEKAALSETRELARLKGELDAAAKGSDAYRRTKEKIAAGYGKYRDGLAEEIERVGLLDATYQKLADSVRASFAARQYDAFARAESDSLDTAMSRNLGKLQDRLAKKLGEEAGSRIFAKLRDAALDGSLAAGAKELPLAFGSFYMPRGLGDDVMGALKQARGGLFETDIGQWLHAIIAAQKLADEMDKKARARFGVDGGAKTGEEKKDGQPARAVLYGEAYKKAGAEWEAAKKALAEMERDKGRFTKEQYERARKEEEEYRKKYADLGGAVSERTGGGAKTENGAERAQREAAERNRRLGEYTESVKRQITRSEMDIAQARIDAMDDGHDKEHARIQLAHDRMVFANQQREAEMVRALQDARELAWENENPGARSKGQLFDRSTVTAADLSAEQRGILEEHAKWAGRAREKAEDDLLAALLRKYRSFEQQRTDINEQFGAERRALENSGAPRAAMDTALRELELKQKAAIKSVSDAEMAAMQKSSDLLAKLFGDASGRSVSELRKIADEAEGLLSYLANTDPADIAPGFGFTAEQLKALRESPKDLEAVRRAVDGLNAAVAKKNPFADLAKALKEVFRAGKTDRTTEQKLAGIGAAAAGSADAIGGLAGKLADVFAAAGNGALAGAMEDVQGVMSSISSIGQGFANGGIAGGIGAAVGEVANWAAKAFGAAAAHRAALGALREEILAQERMNGLLGLRNQLEGERFDTVFGADRYGKALGAIEVYEKAIDRLNGALAGTERQKNEQSLNSFIANLFRIEDANAALKRTYAGLADIAIVTGHEKTGLFGWGKGRDTYSSVLDVYPELIRADGEFNKQLAETVLATRRMSDADRAALRNMIDLYGQYEEAIGQVRDYLRDIFGELGNSMSDALVDAFRNGTDAAEAFRDTVSGMLETLARQMVYSVTLAPVMERAQEQMLEIMKDGGLTDAQKFDGYARVLSDLTDRAVAQQNSANGLMARYRDMAAQKGLDIFGPDEGEKGRREATAKGFAAMSQDSANELNGRFTALQALTHEICTGIRTLVGNSGHMLLLVAGIGEDTKSLGRLETIERDMKAVRDGISDINLKGIAIKK